MKSAWLLVASMTMACGGADATLGDAGNDAGSGNDATTGADSGNPGNDGGNPGSDGGTTLNDAGNPATIPCGTTSCSAPDVCCVDTNGQTPTYTCAGSCPNNTTTLLCVGNDCGSQVCCVYIDQNQQVASMCAATCGQNQAQLCQNVDAGATGCSTNQPCSSQNIGDWGLSSPFGTCGGKGN